MDVTEALLASSIEKVANDWEIKKILWSCKRKQLDQQLKVSRREILVQHKKEFPEH